MTSILKWIEKELLEKVLEAEIGKVVDGPTTASSLLKQLPLRKWGFDNCPGIPYWADEYGDLDLPHVLSTLNRLKGRADQAAPTAYHGLSTVYTIDNQKNIAYEFLYDAPLPPGPAANKGPAASPAPNELASAPPRTSPCPGRRTTTCTRTRWTWLRPSPRR